MRMLDLFCGFHGASKRFIDDPKWEVVSIDNEPRLSPTHVLDLSQVGAVKFVLELGKFDLIWASPPCIEFHKCSKPFWPEFYGKEPSMRLVNVALEIIKMAEPDYWVLENTKHGAKIYQAIDRRAETNSWPVLSLGKVSEIRGRSSRGNQSNAG